MANRTSKTKRDYRIMLYVPREIRPDRDSTGIQVFEFTFVIFRNENQKVRNCGGYDTPEAAPFDNLTFRAQADGRDQKVYGWDITYRSVHSVDLTLCDRMRKMLKRIAAVKFPVSPSTYGQYLQMACACLGVEGAVQQGASHGRGFGYDEDSHVTWKTGEIQWLVDRRISEFFEKHGEALKASRERWSA